METREGLPLTISAYAHRRQTKTNGFSW